MTGFVGKCSWFTSCSGSTGNGDRGSGRRATGRMTGSRKNCDRSTGNDRCSNGMVGSRRTGRRNIDNGVMAAIGLAVAILTKVVSRQREALQREDWQIE